MMSPGSLVDNASISQKGTSVKLEGIALIGGACCRLLKRSLTIAPRADPPCLSACAIGERRYRIGCVLGLSLTRADPQEVTVKAGMSKWARMPVCPRRPRWLVRPEGLLPKGTQTTGACHENCDLTEIRMSRSGRGPKWATGGSPAAHF
jgi:hypothetical protein